MDLTAGSKVFSKFEVLEKIGSGGMGSIYKARDTTLDRVVVLKVLSSHFDHRGSLVRFQNEAKALGRLKHSSIASVYDFGISEEGEAYLAMDFVDGFTLRDFVDSGQSMLLSEKLTIFIQLCEAVRHAHAEGVVHRDIKPENIMLVHSDKQVIKPILLDFGIAKLQEDGTLTGQQLTGSGRIMGSPLFMSPEQAAGQAVTAATDHYSLGCVLYYMLTGKPPLKGESAMETMSLHINAVPDSLQKTTGTPWPSDLEDVVARLLSKRPDVRFQSLSEVIETLKPVVDEALAKESEIQEEEEPPMVAAKSNSFVNAKSIGLTALLGLCVAFPMFQSVFSTEHKEPGKIESSFEQFSVGETIKNALKRDPENLRLAENVSNDDLKVLKGCKTLTFVELSCNRVDDSGVAYLLDSKIRRLILSISAVKTLEPVSKMLDLEVLELMNTQVHDDSLKQIRHLKNLYELRLDETPITDEGLKYLGDLGALERLSLDGTKATLSAARKLSQRLPMCEISIDGKTLGMHDLKNAAVIRVPKDPASALSMVDRLIRETENGFGSRETPMIAQLLYLKWNAAFLLKKYDLAFKCAQESYDIARKTDNRKYSVLSAVALAASNRSKNEIAKALELQEEAINLAISYFGPQHDTTLQAVSIFLADADVNKDFERRKRFTTKFLDLLSEKSNRKPFPYAMALSWQAETEAMKGNYERATALVQESNRTVGDNVDKDRRELTLNRNLGILNQVKALREKSAKSG